MILAIVPTGIDFGTKRSGYSWGTTTKDTMVNWSWEGQSTPQPKTATALLYDQDWTPIAWGDAALEQ